MIFLPLIQDVSESEAFLTTGQVKFIFLHLNCSLRLSKTSSKGHHPTAKVMQAVIPRCEKRVLSVAYTVQQTQA